MSYTLSYNYVFIILQDNDTPLTYATFNNGSVDVVNCLINNGADIHMTEKVCNSVVHVGVVVHVMSLGPRLYNTVHVVSLPYYHRMGMAQYSM